MKAVIMAGGSGKRLAPLTYDTPKPMVRFFSKPVLEYIFELLRKNGFDEVRLSLGYLAKAVEDYALSRSSDDFRISCFTEDKPLGTAGGVKAVAADFSEPFLVISGDAVCDFDLSSIMDFHLTHNADITIACTKVKDPREYGVVEFDASDKVKAFTEKPPWSCAVSDCVNTGIYVLNPEVLDSIPDSKPFDFSNDLFPELLRNGKALLHCQCEGYWCDIGNPEAFLQCHWDVFDMKSKIRLPKITGGIYSEGALVSGDYSIIEPCYIGRNVSIGSGSVVGPYAVIDDGCRIGSNTKIVRSCMLNFSSLGNNSTLNGAILCGRASVKSGCNVLKGAVVGTSAKVNSGSVIGNSVVIPPESSIEASSRISGSIKYSQTALCLNDSNRFSGSIPEEFDAVNAAIIGQALASMEIGRKTGIITDGNTLSKAVAYCITGALISHSSHVWNFGEGFYSQLEFYVRFCALKSGIFVSFRDGKLSVSICGENGLPLSNHSIRELENRIKHREFIPCQPDRCKDVSDMSGVAMMYRREIIRQTDTELSDISCSVKCPNAKITMLLEDCLYQLGCRTGDEITFKINAYGNLLSAFSRECGWLNHDRLAAIVLNCEVQNGRDVSVPFSSPEIFDKIASDNGRKVLRYYQSPTDSSDSIAREMSRSSPFMRDALLMAVKLLNIICTTGKSLARLNKDVPDFYVSRRRIPIDFSPSELGSRLGENEYEITREGIALRFPQGRVMLTASRSGRSLSIISEAANYEISKDLCARAEKLIEGKE